MFMFFILKKYKRASKIFSRKVIRIQIISGQNLPKIKGDKKDIIDPYVVVRVAGYPADQSVFKTRHIEDNGSYEHSILCARMD